VDDERVDVLLVDADAEVAHDAQRRLGVAAPAPAHDARLPCRERADQERAVRDRLVARDADVAVDPGGGLDPGDHGGLVRQPSTAETTTP
jgi:hypothetical protein